MEPDFHAGPAIEPRKVCMAVRKDYIGNNDGAQRILRISRERFAPDTIDPNHRDVAKFMNFKRADQTMGTYLLEFDMLRKQAESRMLMSSGFPDELASASCAHNAAFPKSKESLVLAGICTTLASPEVSSRMRRLFWPRGSPEKQDVLVAADLDTASEEAYFEAWTVYREPKKEEREERGGTDRGKPRDGSLRMGGAP